MSRSSPACHRFIIDRLIYRSCLLLHPQTTNKYMTNRKNCQIVGFAELSKFVEIIATFLLARACVKLKAVNDMPHSHHSHSGQFCRHAAQGTTLEDVVKEAIRKGFKIFGLSEHCPRYRSEDLYPEEVSRSFAGKSLFSIQAEEYLSVRPRSSPPIRNLSSIPRRGPQVEKALRQ